VTNNLINLIRLQLYLGSLSFLKSGNWVFHSARKLLMMMLWRLRRCFSLWLSYTVSSRALVCVSLKFRSHKANNLSGNIIEIWLHQRENTYSKQKKIKKEKDPLEFSFKVTLLSLDLLSPPYPLFKWGLQSKEILLNLGMKCWNSVFYAQGSRVILVVVKVGAGSMFNKHMLVTITKSRVITERLCHQMWVRNDIIYHPKP